MTLKQTIQWEGKEWTYYLRTRKGKWKWWRWFFPGANMDTVYITLGRTIFCPPLMRVMPADILTHEIVHLKQQRFSYLRAFATFWRFYFSKSFRLYSEFPAFHEQYLWVEANGKMNYLQLHQYRRSLAGTLSGKLYGEIITEAEAFERLGQKA